MKDNKICCLLVLSVSIALLLSVSIGVVPVAGASIKLDPKEGEIGDWVYVDISGFSVSVRLYFSSDKAEIGDRIDEQVRAYYETSNTSGFRVPDRLEDGSRVEDVHAGEYYVYAAFPANKEIQGFTTFTVIKGEIWLEPEEGSVGDGIEISGEDLRPEQKITVEYDDDEIDIISGDIKTDSDGKFTCTVIIPDSIIGEHVIIVADESGNEPEAEFTIVPKITLIPAEQEAGKEVDVIGAGFNADDTITVTIDDSRVDTSPSYVRTNRRGSFECTFGVPLHGSLGTRVVEALDRDFNMAEAQLTVLAGIRLSPVTTPDSPGHAGMELAVHGVGFASEAMVTISYSEGGEVIAEVTDTTDSDGNFTTNFPVPNSVAGSHVITATDGTTTATTIFIMEPVAPPMPVPLLPAVAGTAEAEAHFDWEDVIDPSGVSYTLQVASDAGFTNVVVEKEGLPHSEYTLTGEEKLEPAGREDYYWRVKAVDGASNDGEWSPTVLFYVGSAQTALAGWVWYIFYGLGALLLVILVLWLRKRFTQ